MSTLSKRSATASPTLASAYGRLPCHRSVRLVRSIPAQRGRPRGNKPAVRQWPENRIEVMPLPRWKRLVDILLVLALLPWAMLVVPGLYLWVQMTSPGCFLFRQTRIGRGGKPFQLYKFRTMKTSADTAMHEAHVIRLIRSNQAMTKLDFCGDTRVIRGGWMIRMSGMDELPQLINVLRGEMTLVGPRPCTPGEFPLYDAQQRQRFAVQPGITGLWQVKRTADTTFRQMIDMDLSYLQRITLWNDLKILLRTPGTLAAQMMTCLRFRCRRSKHLQALRQGVAAWQRSWLAARTRAAAPDNATSLPGHVAGFRP